MFFRCLCFHPPLLTIKLDLEINLTVTEKHFVFTIHDLRFTIHDLYDLTVVLQCPPTPNRI